MVHKHYKNKTNKHENTTLATVFNFNFVIPLTSSVERAYINGKILVFSALKRPSNIVSGHVDSIERDRNSRCFSRKPPYRSVISSIWYRQRLTLTDQRYASGHSGKMSTHARHP